MDVNVHYLFLVRAGSGQETKKKTMGQGEMETR